MIFQEIKSKVGENSFFSVKDFSDIFNLDYKKSKELLEFGKGRGLFIESREDEFGLKENFRDEDLNEFENYVHNNFILGNTKPKVFDSSKIKQTSPLPSFKSSFANFMN